LNRTFKKSIAAALFLTVSVTAIAPRRSEAFMGGTAIVVSMLLGGVTSQISLLLGGAVLMSAASVAGGIEFINKARSTSGAKRATFWAVALGAIFAGGLILDGSEIREGFRLESLDPENASRLGLTPGEHAAYESELLQINLVNEEALARMGHEFENSKPSVEAVVQSLHRHWHEIAQGALSAESIRAIQKMGASR